MDKEGWTLAIILCEKLDSILSQGQLGQHTEPGPAGQLREHPEPGPAGQLGQHPEPGPAGQHPGPGPAPRECCKYKGH